MKNFKSFFVFVVLSFLLISNFFACTTAIVSGKHTTDGRPLLVKHRDSGFIQNKLMFFDDGDYTYIGLVNSADSTGTEVWGGCNSTGFAIMNSASYNLKPDDDTTSLKDQEGVIMKRALHVCETLDDFEKLLEDWTKPMGIEANFGVIDAHGGAAYYECNNFSFTKIDANDPKIAPFGYVIRTNYSFTGADDEGYGYIRYMNAEELFYQAKATNNLNYKFILQDVSRNLKNSLTNVDLKENIFSEKKDRFFHFEDFTPRKSSVSTILVHGVKPGESPKLATVWTILGFPLCSVAMPTWVDAGEYLPEILLADSTGNAPLCDMALQLKDECFPIKRGSGYRYINITKLINKESTGFMQQLKPVEDKVIMMTDEKMGAWRNHGHIPAEEAHNFYSRINLLVKTAMEKLVSKTEAKW